MQRQILQHFQSIYCITTRGQAYELSHLPGVSQHRLDHKCVAVPSEAEVYSIWACVPCMQSGWKVSQKVSCTMAKESVSI